MKEDVGRDVAGWPEGDDTALVSETGRGSDCDVIERSLTTVSCY